MPSQGPLPSSAPVCPVSDAFLAHNQGPLALTPHPDMEFLEVLTEGLNRVLLVRGGGREVITIYS